MEQALKDAFLGFDAILLEKAVIEELKELTSIEEECSESEPEEGAELDELREEGIMPLNELLEKYSSGRTPPKKEGSSSTSSKSPHSMPSLGSTRTFRPRAGGSGQSSSSTNSAVAAISSGQCSSSTTPKKELSEADEAMVTSSSCKSKIDNAADTVNEPSSTSKIAKTENEVSQTDSSTNGTELKKENYSCPDSSSSKPVDVPVEKPESSTDSKDEISSKSAVNGTIIDSKSPDNGVSTNSVSEVSSGVSSSVSSSAVAAVVSSGGGENGEVTGSVVVPIKETKKEKISSSNVDQDTSDEDENDADVEFDVAYSDSDAEDEPGEDTSEEDSDDDDEVLDDENEAFMSSIVEEPGKDSGCTAVVALLHGSDLYVANAGDSRCVVCRNGKSLDMSVDHKPEDNLEYTRIKNAGGRVTMDGRVNGGLNLSRAIGDHAYKMKKDLPAHEQMISAQPDIKKITLTDEDEFMILACDGIWNSLTSAEVVEFIKQRITEGTDKISKICEEVS